MQLTLVTMVVYAFVVVNTIGNIAALLNLSYYHSFAYGVNQSGRNKEYISFLYRYFLKQILNKSFVKCI